jgi:transcriptional regulator with XRE-family HTH domain
MTSAVVRATAPVESGWNDGRTPMSTGTDHGGTDLGRRIREHRCQAGLTVEEAAARAGMAASYLEYLETSRTPNPTPSGLARLAAALGTTAPALAGAWLDLPPGRQAPLERPALEPLDAGQCRGYLGTSGVGRLVIAEPRGPVAIPVNYAMLGNDIVIRTSGRAHLASAGQPRVSFEVDHLDEALAEGWSVLVSGMARVVTDPDELAAVSALGVAPWAGGDRDTYIRIIASEVTGRRIRATT